MKVKKSILTIIITLVCLCFTSSCDVYTEAPKFKSQKSIWKEKNRVSVEYIGEGVKIITIDKHEYIMYRDDNNAASVGGIIHKIDCKRCNELFHR